LLNGPLKNIWNADFCICQWALVVLAGNIAQSILQKDWAQS